MGGRSYKYLY